MLGYFDSLLVHSVELLVSFLHQHHYLLLLILKLHELLSSVSHFRVDKVLLAKCFPALMQSQNLVEVISFEERFYVFVLLLVQRSE
jgi:hypothetical protein